MRLGHPFGHVVEKRRDLCRHDVVPVEAPQRHAASSGRACWVMRRRLRGASSGSRSMAAGMASEKNRAPWLPPNTSRRNGPSGRRRFIGPSGRLQHIRADRIAGGDDLVCRRDRSRRRQENRRLWRRPVSARNLLARPITAFCSWMMAGNPARARRHQRRQRRIAAKADHGVGPQPRQQPPGLAQAAKQRDAGAQQRHRVLRRDGGRGNDVDLVGREAEPANRSARRSVTRWTRFPRPRNSCASASAGKRWPPVPPAQQQDRAGPSSVPVPSGASGPKCFMPASGAFFRVATRQASRKPAVIEIASIDEPP